MSPLGPDEEEPTELTHRRRRGARIDRALSVPRASDVLADHLRQRIFRGELPPGTLLPTERELATQSGIGRSSVREALKALEIQGLIAVRAGRGGGSEVIRPTRESLAESVAMFIRGGRLDTASLTEVRRIIEPPCAEFAAQRRTEKDIVEIRALNDEMKASRDDTERYLRSNVNWHIRVAAASHSELLAGILIAISEAIHAATDVSRLHEPSLRDATIRAHGLIGDAIAAGDAELARRRMSDHIDAYAELLQATPVAAP